MSAAPRNGTPNGAASNGTGSNGSHGANGAPPAAAPAAVREYLFVRRPVLAIVISAAVTLLGLIAMLALPINRYPQITPPSIQVVAVYPGASAQDVATSVAAPIEQQLNGLNGLLYYKSSNSSDGVMNLSVTFDIARDQDLAAVDVQNAISVASPQLPAAVRQNGITVTKANADILMVGALTSSNPGDGAAYLTNYGKLYVENEMKRLPGVGDASFFSPLDFSMLLSLDPEKMAQLGITVDDVQAAVQQQNATQPGGRLGREPSPAGTQLTIPVATSGQLTTPEQFGAIIVRALPNGSLVRVRDIASVHLGSRQYDISGRLNGKETALFGVYARPGANNLAVKAAVVARMNELAKAFPAGVRWTIPFDTTPFINESIREVIITLAEAMGLVTLVVFVFLQSWRATLIPVLAVPVSIIGTFLGIAALGFTINTLTLFGMVLAIGIVVDDAIVVIENVERIMSTEHVSARVATNRAMGQISGALIAIVLVLCSVFIPVAFVPGITGAMYKQFAVTLVFAVLLSGMVALTLTPALCSLLLKETPEGETHGRFFTWFNKRFGSLTNGYLRAAGGVVRRPRVWYPVFAMAVALIAVLFRRVPSGFVPSEDKGYFALSVQLPDAASLQRTIATVQQVEQIARAEPAVKDVVAIAGLDLLTTSNQTNTATIFVGLKPWGERGPGEDVESILARVNGKLFGLKQAIGFGFNLPEIPGLGTTAGLEMNLQQRSGTDIAAFGGAVHQFVQDANKVATQGANGGVRTDVPQLFVHVDEDAARARGVGTSSVFATLQTMLSTLYINDFTLYGRPYRVQAEAQQQFRQTPEDVGRFYVRGAGGAMIPVSALVTTEMRSAPSLLTRFNGFPSATITGTPRPGESSGQMLAGVEKLLNDKYASQGIGFAYSGESYQEQASGGTSTRVLGLALVLVFLVLAAQYESWTVPFAVLLGVPFGLLGAVAAVWLRGMPNDVYFQVGLFAVIGLAAKNAILIVEFATELVARGASVKEAALEAARERFRPILMTSLAFILGVSPLIVASGAGAGSRHSLGTSVFFGMLGATTLGVFFIPLFYSTIRGFVARRAGGASTAGPGAVPGAPSSAPPAVAPGAPVPALAAVRGS
ncbi:multidrug efflux RND transporter permease subunit [Gemmatimonadetes bacterium T265]|nr:multidrug efflux RND transporter permease subunit [Gemmatimonadetes bacterium T265]